MILYPCETCTLKQPPVKRQETANFSQREINLVRSSHLFLSIHPSLQIFNSLVSTSDNKSFRVSKVQPNSPASRAGLEVGDHIIAVNDVSMEQVSLEQVVLAINAVQSGKVSRGPGA